MRREESFALGAGVVCLAVNAVVAAAVLTSERVAGAPLPVPLLVGAVAYAWLLVAWMLVRRTLVYRRKRRRPTGRVRLSLSELKRTALMAVLGLGTLLGPVLFSIFGTRFPMNHPMAGTKLDGNADPLAWGMIVGAMSLATLLIAGAAVFYAITLLMPVVYSDVRHE